MQWPKDGTPLKGQDAFGLRLPHSSLLVSFQNRLWQTVNVTLSQPLNISGYYEHQLGGQIEGGDFSLVSHNLLRLDLKAEPAENIVFRVNFIVQTFRGKTKFCITEFMPEKFYPPARELPEHLRIFKFEDRYVLDNAFLAFHFTSVMVRVGKQRLPWGTGYVWNLTNIFHPISILDLGVDPPEVEALRLDRLIGEDANLSFILASEEPMRESTLAL